MEAAIVILVVVVVVALMKGRGLTPERTNSARQLGAAAHTLSGEFPTTCHWCRETALAKKMFILERHGGSWRAVDIAKELASDPDQLKAAAQAQALYAGTPAGHKRLCSEKCVRDFLGSEGIAPQSIDFRKCDHCGGSVLASAERCNLCGARRAA